MYRLGEGRQLRQAALLRQLLKLESSRPLRKMGNGGAPAAVGSSSARKAGTSPTKIPQRLPRARVEQAMM